MRWFAIIGMVLMVVPRLGATPPTDKPEKPVIAVITITSPDRALSQENLDGVTSWIREEAMKNVPHAIVLNDESVRQMFATNPDLRKKCDAAAESGCELEFGRILKANYVVTGSITGFGTSLFVTLILHETSTNTPVGGESIQVKNIEAIYGQVKIIAGKLFRSLGGRQQKSAEAHPDYRYGRRRYKGRGYKGRAHYVRRGKARQQRYRYRAPRPFSR